MKKFLLSSVLFLSIIGFIACEDDKGSGNPTGVVSGEIPSTYFGDSLSFTIDVQDEIPLRMLYANLYYGEKLVAAQAKEITDNGSYNMKIDVPYLANYTDGNYRIQIVVVNSEYTKKEQDYDVKIAHHDYSHLILVAGEDEYQMNKVAPNQYKVTGVFPKELNAYIKTPETGGKTFSFGWENDGVVFGKKALIPIENTSEGEYTISFNTLSLEASPILQFFINQDRLQSIDKEKYRIELDLKRDQILSLKGFMDINGWWIHPDYFSIESTDELKFKGADGKYRIYAVVSPLGKVLTLEPLDQDGKLLTLSADGSGIIWIIGNGNIGQPSYKVNAIGWNPDRGFPLVYLGNKKHQITLTVGMELKENEQDINFKFFHQRGWGGEFHQYSISSQSDLFQVDKDANNTESGAGNISLIKGKTLETGASYVFTVDLTNGNTKAVLTVEKK